MDIHIRIAAALHIAFGLLGAAMLSIGMLFGGVAAAQANLPGFLLGFGAMIFIVPMVLAIAKALVGIAVLAGNAPARIALIVFGVLDLFGFPIGTLLGAYTLWALLRKHPMFTGAASGAGQ